MPRQRRGRLRARRRRVGGLRYPVLAHPVGFLARMLPPGHGIHLVSPEREPADLLPVLTDALRMGGRRCRHRGRPYLARRYSLDRMAYQFRQVVATLVTR